MRGKIWLLSASVLFGIVVATSAPAHAGTWVITPSVTTSRSESASAGGRARASSTVQTTAMVLSATVSAATPSSEFAEAQGSYSGTWTFTWQPSGPNDWPTKYRIRHVKKSSYSVTQQNSTGTSKAKVTGGSDLVLVSLPTTDQDVRSFPTPTVSTDTTDPNLTITTRTTEWQSKRVGASSISDFRLNSVITERLYEAAWFQANFMTPADVELEFTVSALDLTARVDADGAGTGVLGIATVFATDLYFGENAN